MKKKNCEVQPYLFKIFSYSSFTKHLVCARTGSLGITTVQWKMLHIWKLHSLH